MNYKVTFTYWSDEKDVRSINASSPSMLQGILVALAENPDIELLNVELFNYEKKC